MRPGQGARRFLLVAGDVMFAEIIDSLRRLTGRRLPAIGVPVGLARRLIGSRRKVPGDLEGPWFAMQRARCDSSATERALGIRLRPPGESIADTVRWLHATGRLDDRRAGRVAAEGRDDGHAHPMAA